MKLITKLGIMLALFVPAIARATVTSTATSVSFTCTGSTGPFPFTFPISDSTALAITQNGTVLASTTYTVSPVNNNYDNGGSVTLNTACPSEQTLVITRITPQTQTSVFADNMPTPMATIENGLDKLTELEQEQSDSLHGLWMLPIYSSAAPSGNCSPVNQIDYVTGGGIPYLQFTCVAGIPPALPQWTQTSGGGGGSGSGCLGNNLIANGCTGSISAAGALVSLGVPIISVTNAAACDGTTDDYAALNAMSLAYKDVSVAFAFPIGRKCAISHPVNAYSMQNWYCPGMTTQDINAASTPCGILALSGFTGTRMLNLVGTTTVGGTDFNSAIIGPMYFDQGTNSGLSAIAPDASTTFVLDSTFQHLRFNTTYGVNLGAAYDQSNTFTDLISTGKSGTGFTTEQLLSFAGNVNTGNNIHVEGAGGSDSTKPYVAISGGQNTLNAITIEGNCGTGKTDLGISNAGAVGIDYYHDECNIGSASTNAVDVENGVDVSIGDLVISLDTEKVKERASRNVNIDSWALNSSGGVPSALFNYLDIDSTSDFNVGDYTSNLGDAIEFLDHPNVTMGRQRITAAYQLANYAQIQNAAQENGENLLLNGDFSGGLYDWTDVAGNGTFSLVASPTSNGLMVQDAVSGAASYDRITQPITITSAMVGHEFSFSILANVTSGASVTGVCPYVNGVGITYGVHGCSLATVGLQRLGMSVIPSSAGTLSVGLDIETTTSTAPTVIFGDAVFVQGPIPGKYGGRFGSVTLNGKPLTFASAAPTTGTWTVGAMVFNSAVTSSSNIGWVCTTAGSPGTWTAWGAPSLSGMTTGQVAIAGSPTTITSSKALAGSGASITTGPTSSTSGDAATFTGTGGQIQDAGFAPSPALGNNVGETSGWTLAANTVYRFTGSGASNATTPASVTTGFIASIWNQGSAAVTVVTGGPTLVCVPSSCVVPIGASASITTDGTNFDAQISNANGSAFGTAANANTISAPTGIATYSTGTGITSVVCASGYSCNNTRGTLTIVAAVGATTGTIATVNFSTTLSAAPACFAYENGGSTNFGIGNSAPSTSGFNITAGISVSLATLTVNYTCQP